MVFYSSVVFTHESFLVLTKNKTLQSFNPGYHPISQVRSTTSETIINRSNVLRDQPSTGYLYTTARGVFPVYSFSKNDKVHGKYVVIFVIFLLIR